MKKFGAVSRPELSGMDLRAEHLNWDFTLPVIWHRQRVVLAFRNEVILKVKPAGCSQPCEN